ELRRDYAERKEAIRCRLDEFAAVRVESYFYELVYCLMTPQSSAVNAGKVVALLQEAEMLHQELELEELLYRKEHYIRFHNTKAKRIREARGQMPRIVEAIGSTPDSAELRAWLVKNVKGLGWKEASHFLRNIGRRDLAILDRHILKNLRAHGALRSLPRTLTPKRYLSIERSFRRFALRVGISMDELDLLFWSRETGQILK
ncbi:MAG TPA: N-glycosylase/DNA lyase, partial [Bacteroidota bacterium]